MVAFLWVWVVTEHPSEQLSIFPDGCQLTRVPMGGKGATVRTGLSNAHNLASAMSTI